MNIWMAVPSAPPRPGGQEAHVLALAEALAARGHLVQVMTLAGETHGVNPRYQHVRHALSAPPFQADILHIHGSRNSIVAAAAFRPPRVPIVWTPHCFYPARTRSDALVKGVFDAGVMRLFMRRVHTLISLTRFDYQDATRLGWRRDALVIPNGVNERSLEEQEPPAWELPPRYVVFTGRLDSNKNALFLLKQYPKLVARGLGLVLLGPDGDQAAEIRNRMTLLPAGDVVAPGMVTEKVRNFALARAAALVLPSRAEGLPTSALEALAVGTPVVLTNSGGNRALTEEAPGAFGFELNVSETFDTALDSAVAMTDDDRRSIAEHARKHFAWEALVGRIESVYADSAV